MCREVWYTLFTKEIAMNKKQKIIFFSGLGVVIALIVLVVVLLVQSMNGGSGSADQDLLDAQARADSLALANDQLKLTNEFNQLNAEFEQSEMQGIQLKNDSILVQYDEAKKRVQKLLKELEQEKRSNKKNQAASQQKIRELEAEISTLRGIVKHYLEEIKRLGEENEGLKRENQDLRAGNADLQSQVSSATSRNEELSHTVKLAKKLNITGLSLQAYNKKGKAEKKVSKATNLGVSFTVAPNNTAASGMKQFAVRILSPEGSLLGGAGSVSYDGGSVGVSAKREYEYDNGELRATIYCNVGGTTLTAGEYTVDVFCDGYRLGSRRVTLK